MSLHDLMTRTDTILKKYDKYDAPMGKKQTTKSNDPFQEEYDEVVEQVEHLMQQADEIQAEKNRAVVAARNAELRKQKNILMTMNIESLQKKVKKGKNVTKPLIEERLSKVAELADRIAGIPDGVQGIRRPVKSGVLAGTSKQPIHIDPYNAGNTSNPGHYEHTAETSKFQQEWEHSKKKQDMQLDRIEKGVSTLGEIAKGMQEELDKQNPIINEIDSQMDKVTNQLKSNNTRLKGLVTQMRSSRNFCVDVILICLLLGIGAYLYSMFA